MCLSSETSKTRNTPKPGQTWRSRDPRDDGLRVTIIDVANGFVRIQRYRKTTVSLSRFHRDYEPVFELETDDDFEI